MYPRAQERALTLAEGTDCTISPTAAHGAAYCSPTSRPAQAALAVLRPVAAARRRNTGAPRRNAASKPRSSRCPTTPARRTTVRGRHGSSGPPGTGGRRSRPPLTNVATYLQARHAGGTAPATIRVARAAISKGHLVSDCTDPTTDNLCRDVLRRIGRDGRGQVVGVGWDQAVAAAALAEGDGTLRELRDGAIIRLMSDTLARGSEVAALLQCGDVEPAVTNDGGTVHIRASKTDQRGTGLTRYIGPATWVAAGRYLAAAGHTTGPLFRRVLRGGHDSAKALAADSIRVIVRDRVAAVTGGAGRIGGHSLRVGSARELAASGASGASVAELQQAGGWRSPGWRAAHRAVRLSGTVRWWWRARRRRERAAPEAAENEPHAQGA